MDIPFASKKSVSPIVSAIFLMGVMLVAITATVTLIYPNIVKLEDEQRLSTTTTQFSQLDQTLQTLMNQGKGASVGQPFSLDQSALFADNTSVMELRFTYDSTAFSKSATINYTRLVAQIPIKSQILDVGQKKYYKGIQAQNFFALNSSTLGYYPWAIINATRPQTQDTHANVSFSYRPKFFANFEGTTLVLKIIFVSFKFTGERVATSSEPVIQYTYDGLIANETQMFDGSQFFPAGGTLSVTLTTTLSDGSPPFIEVPFKYGVSSFFLKTEVQFHQFTVHIP